MLHRDHLPRIWLEHDLTELHPELMSNFADLFDENGFIILNEAIPYTDKAKTSLIEGMKCAFLHKHGVSLNAVEMVYADICPFNGGFMSMAEVVELTSTALRNGTLTRCLNCGRMDIQPLEYTPNDLLPGGLLYETVYAQLGEFTDGLKYRFKHIANKVFTYNTSTNSLVVLEDEEIVEIDQQLLSRGGKFYETAKEKFGLHSTLLYKFSTVYPGYIFKYNIVTDRFDIVSEPKKGNGIVCRFCSVGPNLKVNNHGNPISYADGQATMMLTTNTSCCGRKHFHNGKLYDNKPTAKTFVFQHQGQSYSETIELAVQETDATMNTNADAEADLIIRTHFGFDFSTLDLRDQLVKTISREIRLLSTRLQQMARSHDARTEVPYFRPQISLEVPAQIYHYTDAAPKATPPLTPALTSPLAQAPATEAQNSAVSQVTVLPLPLMPPNMITTRPSQIITAWPIGQVLDDDDDIALDTSTKIQVPVTSSGLISETTTTAPPFSESAIEQPETFTFVLAALDVTCGESVSMDSTNIHDISMSAADKVTIIIHTDTLSNDNIKEDAIMPNDTKTDADCVRIENQVHAVTCTLAPVVLAGGCATMVCKQ